MRLLVVIINYNTAGLTIDCLRSLAAVTGQTPGTRVVVVDNCSPDGQAARIGEAIAAEAMHFAALCAADRNGGFAYGNNFAIGPAMASADRPDYVLLLNPDTVVRDGALARLVEFMDAHPRCGIAGSRLEDPDGTPQFSAFRFHTPLAELESTARLGPVTRLLRRWRVTCPLSDRPVRCDWVSGASLMVRREVFEQIGLLDDGFFMYYEEVDFCRRAALAGWEAWYVPSSRVVHLVGMASGIKDGARQRKRRPQYWFDSRRRFFSRAGDWWNWALADLGAIVGLALSQTRYALTGRRHVDPPGLLLDLVRNSVFVRGFR